MKTLVLSMISIAATVAAMTACTSESDGIDNIAQDAKVEIKASAGIGSITTKAAVIPGQELTDIAFVRADGEADPTWTSANVTSIDGKIEASTGKITFTPAQYYPTTGNAYFVGYYPKAKGTLESGAVTYTNLTGQEDIMYATKMSGAKADAATPLSTSFAHKLTQIKFKVIAKDATAAAVWGDITSIQLVKQSNEATLNISDGEVKFTEKKDQPFKIFSGEQSLSTSLSDEIGYVLAEATLTGGYEIEIKTTMLPDGTIIKLDNVTGTASTSYITTITFSGTNVDAKGTIGAWTENNDGTGEVK